MTATELLEAKLLVYTTDGNVDAYKAGDWTKYYVEDNHLSIIKAFHTSYFTLAIYNMNYVEKVVVDL